MPSLDYVVPLFIILLVSLSFHEAAHAWTADRLGDPTARMLGRVTMNPLAHIDWIGTVLFPLVALYSNVPLLGWAKPVPVNFRNLKSPRRDFAIVALAGPVSNLILAAACAVVIAALGGFNAVAPTTAGVMLFRALSMNVLLAVFNMLPVPPLDGGNVLAGFVPAGAARALDQLRPWGFLILYAMLFSGVLDRVIVPIALDIVDLLVRP